MRKFQVHEVNGDGETTIKETWKEVEIRENKQGRRSICPYLLEDYETWIETVSGENFILRERKQHDEGWSNCLKR